MKDNDLYDFLQSYLPTGLQFINPYIDNSPVPLDDYAVMNILYVTPVTRISQQRQNSYDDIEKTVSINYDWEKIYKVQFDFYGSNALDNALNYQHNLQVNLDDNTYTDEININIKEISEIRNLSDLLQSKKYLKRYSFDISLFVIDTITKEDIYLTNFQNTICRVGNN